MGYKKCLSVGLVLILISTLSTSCFAKEINPETISSGNYQKGYRYNIQGWVYLHIEGDPYERGYQYGYLASKEIVDMMYRWSNWAYNQKIYKKIPVDIDSDNYDKISETWWNLCISRSNRLWLKHYPDEYIEEMKGIAAGIRDRGGKIFGRPIEFTDVLALNQIVDHWFSYDSYLKHLHPLRGIGIRIGNFLSMLFDNEFSGSCTAFMATGDATSDGGIVVGHTTHIPKLYIPERFNFIVDVVPSQGNHFVMVGCPGSIWSMTDYYQNDKGLILTETSYLQGAWNKRGVPIAVRARNAIQYSDTIDEAIEYLKKGNNGIYCNEWLIGDTKTGEIASLELAMFNTPVKRTNNGFYWSCNHPHDSKVLREIYGVPSWLYNIVVEIKPDIVDPRIKKFKEIEKECYGEIDLELAKQILGTYPLCKTSSDGKVSNTKLVKKLGFYAYMGNPNGTIWKTKNKLEKKYKGITDLPSIGWTEIYPLLNYPVVFKNKNIDDKPLKKNKLLSQSKTNLQINNEHMSIANDVIYTGDNYGNIKALSLNNENTLWQKQIDSNVVKTSVSKDTLYVGSEKNLYAINKKSGQIKWRQDISSIFSDPVYNDDFVVISSNDGAVYAFDVDSGEKKWEYKFSHPAYLSEISQNSIYINSDDTCYKVDVENKKLLWMKKTDGPISSPPRANNENVLFGSWDGNVYCLDQKNGNVLWNYQTGWGIDSTPAVSNGKVYIGGLDNNFYALDKKSGEPIWYYTCKSAIHSNPVTYGEYVFFGCDDGKLYALNQDNGDLEWSFAPNYYLQNDANSYLTSPIYSDPIIENGKVYIEVEGNLYALDPQTEVIKNKEKESNPSNDNILYMVFLGVMLIICIVFFIVYRKKKHQT